MHFLCFTLVIHMVSSWDRWVRGAPFHCCIVFACELWCILNVSTLFRLYNLSFFYPNSRPSGLLKLADAQIHTDRKTHSGFISLRPVCFRNKARESLFFAVSVYFSVFLLFCPFLCHTRSFSQQTLAPAFPWIFVSFCLSTFRLVAFMRGFHINNTHKSVCVRVHVFIAVCVSEGRNAEGLSILLSWRE